MEEVFQLDEEEEDEEQYDKFVPTSNEILQEFKRLSMAENGGNGIVGIDESEFYIRDKNTNRIHLTEKIVGIYTPPENFSMVCKGIYRSSFPRIENFSYLHKLGLKSILCLIPEEYPNENVEFNEKEGIKFYQIGLSGNKEPFVKIKPHLVKEALEILNNVDNHPILVHCNRGKHRTGCVIGCLRKSQNWSHIMIFDEYRKFATPKERPLDLQFIEMYTG